IDILDIDVAVIILGFRLRRSADHLPYGEDLDLAAELCRGRLHFGNLCGIAGERCARACGGDEKSIAIAQCEWLADGGRARIHQERPRFAVRLRIGARVVELKIAAAEIERAVAGPRELHHVDPFLRIVVALVMLALLDAEHVELAFVPADDNVYADAALADMI